MRTAALRATLVGYAGLTVAPAAAVFPGPTWSLLIGGCLLGMAGGTVVTDRVDTVEWLSTVPRGLAGLVVPLVWVGLVVSAATSIPTAIRTPWFAGVVAVVVWLLAVYLAAHYREQDRMDEATTLVTFESRPPPETRRQLTLMVGAFAAITVLGGALLVTVGGLDSVLSTFGWLPGTVGVYAALLATRSANEVTVTDVGVAYQGTLHEWDSFESVETSENTLTLTRTRWYQSELNFDRGDIEDEQQLLEAFASRLQGE